MVPLHVPCLVPENRLDLRVVKLLQHAVREQDVAQRRHHAHHGRVDDPAPRPPYQNLAVTYTQLAANLRQAIAQRALRQPPRRPHVPQNLRRDQRHQCGRRPQQQISRIRVSRKPSQRLFVNNDHVPRCHDQQHRNQYEQNLVPNVIDDVLAQRPHRLNRTPPEQERLQGNLPYGAIRRITHHPDQQRTHQKRTDGQQRRYHRPIAYHRRTRDQQQPVRTKQQPALPNGKRAVNGAHAMRQDRLTAVRILREALQPPQRLTRGQSCDRDRHQRRRHRPSHNRRRVGHPAVKRSGERQNNGKNQNDDYEHMPE